MRIKYPRTFHLPFSPGMTSDDKVIKSYDHLEGRKVVITEKMDGENTTLYRDYSHARSIDSKNHPSRDWLKKFHSGFAYKIPEGMRVCGENLYAKHSIGYTDLKSYFYGFSVWEGDICLDWESTQMWFDELGITSVPVLIEPHIFDLDVLHALAKEIPNRNAEGFVVRVVDSFAYSDFSKSVAKWVRKNHVQTDEHWMQREIVPNGLE